MRPKLLAAMLLLLLATFGRAAEFDLALFPFANEGEVRFREALAAARQNPVAGLAALKALPAEGLPPEALTYAAATLSPPGEAEPLYEELLRLGPKSPFFEESLARLAALKEEAGDLGRAAELLEKLKGAAQRDDVRASALGRLLAIRERQGELQKALKIAVELYVDYPHRAQAEEAGNFILRDTGDPWGALGDEDLYKRGKTLLDSGSRKLAVETLAQLKKRQKAPTTKVNLALGKALHYLRRYQESLEPLSQAARQSKDAETIQSAIFWHARSLFGLDRGDEGAGNLLKLAKRYPADKSAPVWLYQAYRVFETRSMQAQAGEARTMLLKGYPGSEEAAELGLGEGWKLYQSAKYPEAAKNFQGAAEGAGRGWLRVQALFWAARCTQLAGDAEGAAKAYARLLAEYPVGYYARAALYYAPKAGQAQWMCDPRGKGRAPLKVEAPLPGDLPQVGPWAQASAYVRLGLGNVAKRLMGEGNAPAWLRYFAEDFSGAIKASGVSWQDWPPPEKRGKGVGEQRLYYPVAYPASTARAAAESEIHPNLILAIAHTESHFDPDAYSLWEARGLMQFIPATGEITAKALGIQEFRDQLLFDPPTALRLGARHLHDLLDLFKGNVVSAVAAYNAGEAVVAKWREKWPEADEADFVEQIPYKETRRYVKKVLTALDAYDRLSGEGGVWLAAVPTQGE